LNNIITIVNIEAIFGPKITGIVYILFNLSPSMSRISNTISFESEPKNIIFIIIENKLKFTLSVIICPVEAATPVKKTEKDTSKAQDIFFTMGIFFKKGE
jgi:hypothetical protein